jgi:hypothetical protein
MLFPNQDTIRMLIPYLNQNTIPNNPIIDNNTSKPKLVEYIIFSLLASSLTCSLFAPLLSKAC